jgi:hypothetical protein
LIQKNGVSAKKTDESSASLLALALVERTIAGVGEND